MRPSLTLTEETADISATRPTPRFLQGVFPFVGKGLFDLAPLDDTLLYTVPTGHKAQVVYFRAGNHSDDLLYLTIAADGVPIRYFAIGPKSDFHVPLVIVEEHLPGVQLSLMFAAPRGLSGTLIVDAGILEALAQEGTL